VCWTASRRTEAAIANLATYRNQSRPLTRGNPRPPNGAVREPAPVETFDRSLFYFSIKNPAPSCDEAGVGSVRFGRRGRLARRDIGTTDEARTVLHRDFGDQAMIELGRELAPHVADVE